MTKLSDIYGNFFLGVDYVKVSDVKAYNVDGGSFTLGAWRTRDINTEDSDDSSICTIASNQITLEAGTYICTIKAGGYGVNTHAARLYNISDSAVELVGMTAKTVTGYYATTNSCITGKFTISTQKTFEVQHRCFTSQATSGFGLAHSFSDQDNIYTVAEFRRVAS